MVLSAEELIGIRRGLHQIPELALQETKTQAFLLRHIADLDCPWLEVRTIPEVPTAILVRLAGTAPTLTLAYRADMDALPIVEETGLPFTSQHLGQMHACGHDMHMTVAFGILDYFATHQPKDNVLIFFQPAEEADYGGKRFFDAGGFNGKWQPDAFYGTHINPALPTGTIATNEKTLMAGTTEIHLTFTGKDGHAAYPHLANDALVAAANFVTQVQTVVSRNVNPLEGGVVTIGKLTAGTIGNVIAGTAHLDGTIRALTQANLVAMQQRVREIAQGIGLSFQVEVECELIQGGYMPVENDPQLAAELIATMQADEGTQLELVEPAMTGEDFGFLLQQFPGVMCWLGVGDPQHSLHDAGLQPDENALVAGVTAWVNFFQKKMGMKENV